MGQYTDKMTQKCVKISLFVRIVTHYGSNESNDSLGVFSAGCAIDINYTDTIVRNVLTHCIADPDIQPDLLGNKKQDMTLEEVFKSVKAIKGIW